MANRFTSFQPQQYIESYQKLPWEMLAGMGEMYNKKLEESDKLTADIGKGLAQVYAMNKDSDKLARKEVTDSYNNELAKIQAEGANDPIAALPKLKQFAYKLNNDITSGTIYNLNKRYADDITYSALIDADKNLSPGEKELIKKRSREDTPDFAIDPTTGQAGDYKKFGYYNKPDIQKILGDLWMKMPKEDLERYGVERRGNYLVSTVDGEHRISPEEMFQIFYPALKNNTDVTNYYNYYNDLNTAKDIENRDDYLSANADNDIRNEAASYANAWQMHSGKTGITNIQLDPEYELGLKQAAAAAKATGERLPDVGSDMLYSVATNYSPKVLDNLFTPGEIQAPDNTGSIKYNLVTLHPGEDVKINFAKNADYDVGDQTDKAVQYKLRYSKELNKISNLDKSYATLWENSIKKNSNQSVRTFVNVNAGDNSLTHQGQVFMRLYKKYGSDVTNSSFKPESKQDADALKRWNGVLTKITNPAKLYNDLQVYGDNKNYNKHLTSAKNNMVKGLSSLEKEALDNGISTSDLKTGASAIEKKTKMIDELGGETFLQPNKISQLRVQFESGNNKINAQDPNTGEIQPYLLGYAILTANEAVEQLGYDKTGFNEDKFNKLKEKGLITEINGGSNSEALFKVPVRVRAEVLKDRKTQDLINETLYGKIGTRDDINYWEAIRDIKSYVNVTASNIHRSTYNKLTAYEKEVVDQIMRNGVTSDNAEQGLAAIEAIKTKYKIQ